MYKFKHSVKDNSNLLSYNQWSCCRYQNATTGFNLYGTTTATPAEDYLIVRNSVLNSYTKIFIEYNLTPEDSGKTIISSSNIFPDNTSIAFQFSLDNVWCAGTNASLLGKFQKLTLSKVIPENSQVLTISWVATSQNIIPKFFLESVNLKIQ